MNVVAQGAGYVKRSRAPGRFGERVDRATGDLADASSDVRRQGGDMRRVLQIRDEPGPPLRVMLVDSNAVFRAACRALLLTEGVDVVADVARGYEAIELVQRLRPDVVLVEATDRAPRGPEIAALICSLPDAPSVLLISTEDRSQLAAAIGARGHLAKAEICAEAIASATATPSSSTTQPHRPPAEPSA